MAACSKLCLRLTHFFFFSLSVDATTTMQALSDKCLAFGEGLDDDDDDDVSMARPFGAALLIAGWDEDGPALYYSDPSGALRGSTAPPATRHTFPSSFSFHFFSAGRSPCRRARAPQVCFPRSAPGPSDRDRREHRLRFRRSSKTTWISKQQKPWLSRRSSRSWRRSSPRPTSTLPLSKGRQRARSQRLGCTMRSS